MGIRLSVWLQMAPNIPESLKPDPPWALLDAWAEVDPRLRWWDLDIETSA